MTPEDYDLLEALALEYWSIVAANPDWEATLTDFLESRKVDQDLIREYMD